MKRKHIIFLLPVILLATVAGFWLANVPADLSFEPLVNVNPQGSQASQHRSRSSTKVAPQAIQKLTASPKLPLMGLTTLPTDLAWAASPAVIKTPALAKADSVTKAVASVKVPTRLDVSSLKAGSQMHLPMPDGGATGVVTAVQTVEDGTVTLSGTLSASGSGEFFITVAQSPLSVSGRILNRATKTAVVVRTNEGEVEFLAKPLSAVVCSMPRAPGTVTRPMAASGGAPKAPFVVPALDSRPTARGVIYLDFDGEVVTDPDWRGGQTITAEAAIMGNGSTLITESQITDVWNRVVEDFRPFNITVTTIRSRYFAAPAGERARCIITPTDSWYGGTAGGVAFLRSWRGSDEGYSDTIPCWIWNNATPASMAMTISHEVGHMLNLSHDGTWFDEYYDGHDGTGLRSWGPIMGAPFNRQVIQFDNGTYPNANNVEDDVQVAQATISEAGFITTFAPDDAGATVGTARTMSPLGTVNETGTAGFGDTDYLAFKSNGGAFDFRVEGLLVDPNFDGKIDVLDSTGNPVSGTFVTALSTRLGTRIQGSLSSVGQYYISIAPRGNPPAGSVLGYPGYGSAGAYSVLGFYVPLPEAPVITREPAPVVVVQNGTAKLSVAVLSNNPVNYQWYKKQPSPPDLLLSGKTKSELVLAKIQPASAGEYYVTCTNIQSSVTSAVAAVEVRYKPVIATQPSPVTQPPVAVGTPVSYTVSANGTAPLTYQWFKNKVLMAGETSATLNLGSVDWFDGASYLVKVTNPLGSVTSKTVSLVVASPPVFVTPLPAVKYIPNGGTASVSVSAVGTGTIKYAWFKDTTLIAGVTGSTLNFKGISGALNGSYTVQATNTVGTTPAPNAMLIEAHDKPVITQHPLQPTGKGTVNAGASISLTCTSSGTNTMDDPLRFQWQLNNLNISDGGGYTGTQTSVLLIDPAHWVHRGNYRCVVSNAVGVAISKTAALTVVSPPVILTHPLGIKIATGKSGVLSVVAGGTGTLRYQWYKGSTLIPKATSSKLTLSRATAAGTNGDYHVEVTSVGNPPPPAGTAVSNTATVVVEDAPVPGPIVSSTGKFAVTTAEAFTLSVTPGGAPVLRFQWQRNNVDIPGETNSTLSFAAASTADAASFRVRVYNDVGSVLSSSVKIGVYNLPTIVSHPTNASKTETEAVKFTVTAGGGGPFKYKWFRNGSAVTGNTSATTATLSIARALIGTHDGIYSVEVSNPATSILSDSAALALEPVPAPTIYDVRPIRIAPGSRILVSGENLSWISSSKIGSSTVKHSKLSDTELFITAATSGGSLTVTSRGGTAAGAIPITIITNLTENDNFLDAKFLLPNSNGFLAAESNNYQATYENLDPFVTYGKTMWFRWTASSTALVELDIRLSGFHLEGAVYVGPRLPFSPSGLSTVGYIADHEGQTPDPGTLQINATKGLNYYLILDSGHGTGTIYADSGRMTAVVKPVSAAPQGLLMSSFESDDQFSVGPLDGQSGWESDGGDVTVAALNGDQSLVLGGQASGQDHPVMVSAPLTTTAGSALIAATSINVHATAGSGESFTWGLYDATGLQSLGILIDTSSSELRPVLNGNVEASSSVPFQLGTSTLLGLDLDQASGAWSITVDGMLVTSGIGWKRPDQDNLSLGATWQPAPGTRSGGWMEMDDVSINALPPPEANQIVPPQKVPSFLERRRMESLCRPSVTTK
jgi:hypothetical protein